MIHQVPGKPSPPVSWAQQGYQILSDYPVEPWFAIVPGVQTGTRRLSNHPLFAQVLRESGLIQLAEQLLQGPVGLARALFFDKTAQSNWAVPWHQDLSLAVAERVEVMGFGPWSCKEGILDERAILSLTQSQEVVCNCAASQVLAMSPLLLHASRRAARPGHHRVVHLEFCGAQLPPGLQLFAGRPGLDA